MLFIERFTSKLFEIKSFWMKYYTVENITTQRKVRLLIKFDCKYLSSAPLPRCCLVLWLIALSFAHTHTHNLSVINSLCALCASFTVWKAIKKDGEEEEQENSHKFSSKSVSFSTGGRETGTETKVEMKLEDRDKSRAALNIIACSEAFVRKSLWKVCKK